jgi:hypothetical protein
MLNALLAALAIAQQPSPPHLEMGHWIAQLDGPHGAVPFQFVTRMEDGRIHTGIENGEEVVRVPETRLERVAGASTGEDDAWQLVLDFPHYDSRVRATVERKGRALAGEWRKRSGPDRWTVLPFRAEAKGAGPRFAIPPVFKAEPVDPLIGRWSVKFAKDARPAVALFAKGFALSNNQVDGTILTSTGDYRYLSGVFFGREVHMSCFDGAHAFLLDGKLETDGTLSGRFASGDTWTDTWTAVRDEEAELADGMSLASWNDGFGLAMLQYPDLDGNLVSLGDARFAGQVRILQVTGSWCPNCHDETKLLAQLDHGYREKGLSITALCFEVSGDRERDSLQARRMLARHDAGYLALLAGRSDKAASRQALPALDEVHAFPTTIFLHRDGRVRAVHTGFSGPAAPEDHAKLAVQFHKIVQELLAEPAPKGSVHEQAIVPELWRDERDEALMSFERAKDGTVRFESREIVRPGKPIPEKPLAEGVATFDGATVRLGAEPYHFDKRARVILDPRDVAHRFTPGVRSPFPFVDGTGYSKMQEILEGLVSQDAVRRRESVFYLALQLAQDRSTPAEYGGGRMDPALGAGIVPLLDDADPLVRATACWAAGACELVKAADALAKNLEHGFAPVRREAARALGALKHVSALPALEKLADGDIDPLVRARAAESLTLLGKK